MIIEVAPPGWGHTKAEKEKTKPDKPKSKIGGSAAAFKRALDDGRFKGLPGDKTKKEKTASMFKLMWSMKKKGDKPHYKPGTDKKYEKYQEEVILEKDLNAAERRALPDKDFVFPGKGEGPEGKQRGAYPINDKKHARNALAMAAAHASPEKLAKVRSAVKKKFPSIEVSEEKLEERVGGSGSLVRQGVKVGGKKGGRAVQTVQSTALAAGQDAKVKASQGNQSKMIGTGRAEKAGALVGGLAGAVGGGLLDGPAPVGDIIGGIAGSKVGGKIGRQIDKGGSALKKAVTRGESFEIDKSAHKKAQKKSKMRNLAIGNENPNEKAAAEKKAGGPKLIGEGKLDRVMDTVRRYTNKKKAKKHDYGRDAGAEAARRLRKKDHEKVNFLNPDD